MRLQGMVSHLGQHPVWHVCGIMLLMALAAINSRAKSSGILLMALWNMTGVIFHELAHLIAGIIFRAKPAGLSLIPHRDGNRWRLGSVRFARITAINAVPVALAPLGLAGLAYWIVCNWFDWYAPTFAMTLALYAVVFMLLYNSLPSRQDLRIACNLKSFLLYSPLILTLAVYFVWPTIKPLISG